LLPISWQDLIIEFLEMPLRGFPEAAGRKRIPAVRHRTVNFPKTGLTKGSYRDRNLYVKAGRAEEAASVDDWHHEVIERTELVENKFTKNAGKAVFALWEQ
jgi:hypothetical protein